MEEESSEIHKKLKDDARVGKEIKDEDEGKTFERNRGTRPAKPAMRRLHIPCYREDQEIVCGIVIFCERSLVFPNLFKVTAETAYNRFQGNKKRRLLQGILFYKGS